MRLRTVLFALSLCLTGCGGEAEAPASAVKAPPGVTQLGPWLQAEAVADRFSGAVIVARGDAVLHRAAYGPADRATGAPLTPEHRFRLASLSKQFTAAAILRLQDKGVLSVDDSLCKWLEPCPEAWRPITLHHLLSHQSGVPDLMTRRDWSKLRWREWTPAELAADSARLKLDFAPGTDVRYSNAAYNLLGSVVEKASGRAFAEQLRADLLDPLGLKNTGWDDETVPLATGYAQTAEGLGPRRRSGAKVVFASGALYSTVDDMLAWSRALHGGRVLSARSYAQMTAADPARHPVRARWGVPQRFGYGLFVGEPGLRYLPPFADRQVFHSGSWSGFRAHITHQPEADVHVVLLSNNYDGETPLGFAAGRALAEALGRPIPTGRLPRDPRPLAPVPAAVEPNAAAGA